MGRAVYLDGEQKNTQDLKNCKQDAWANMSISVPRQYNSLNCAHITWKIHISNFKDSC